ncbi:hypothetical protein BURKHO8Y_230013 [Burkholderia sp. 8Y]|nr:hypothetical protein BURKHO8Y_230013 [Burkholderia sp. 8Y]
MRFVEIQVLFNYLDADFFWLFFDVNLPWRGGDHFEVKAQPARVCDVFSLVVIAQDFVVKHRPALGMEVFSR